MNWSQYYPYLKAALVAIGSSALVSLILLRARFALDVPNDRSLHTSPTPRTGGLGVLAGGMTFSGLCAYAIAAGLQGHAEICVLSVCVAFATLGFLVFNFPPARIFMGDVGSIPLGFLAGAVGLLGWSETVWPAVFPVIVFPPFLVDATVTLVKRAVRGEPVWNAHREHYYLRLILSGWTHRRTAIVEYVLMSICSLAGLYIVFADFKGQLFAITALSLFFAAVILMIDRRRQPARSRGGVAR